MHSNQFYYFDKLTLITLITRPSVLENGKDSSWTCYYRALYENWRSETPLSRPNYWSIFFYCPSPNLQACKTLNALGAGKKYFDKASNRTRSYPDKQLDEVNVTLQLTMRLRTKTWYASVSGKMQQTQNLASKSTNASNRNLNHLAICVAVPYTSNDYDKVNRRYIIVSFFNILIIF